MLATTESVQIRFTVSHRIIFYLAIVTSPMSIALAKALHNREATNT